MSIFKGKDIYNIYYGKRIIKAYKGDKLIWTPFAPNIEVLGLNDIAFHHNQNLFTPRPEWAGQYDIVIEEDSNTPIPGTRYMGDFTPGSQITLYEQNDVIIEGLEFGADSPKHVIQLYMCNGVTIRNCYFHDSNVIYMLLDGCSNIIIEDCMFENIVCGAYLHYCSNIKIRFNDVLNLQQNEEWVGNFVFLNECDGAGNYIGYNAIENIEGQSYCNDLINIYITSGTEESPFIVEHNWARGGGPHPTSGGLMVPDVDGEYIIVRNNIVVNPGQYGIAASAGRHVIIEDNLIFSEPKPWNNVGLYATNFFPEEMLSYDLTMWNNRINYLGAEGQAADMWLDEGAFGGTIFGKETNIVDRTMTADILPAKILRRLTT